MPNQYGELTDEEAFGGAAPAARTTPRPGELSDEEFFGQHVEIAPVSFKQLTLKNLDIYGPDILSACIIVALFILFLFEAQIKGFFLKVFRRCANAAGGLIRRGKEIILACLRFFGFLIPDYSPPMPPKPPEGKWPTMRDERRGKLLLFLKEKDIHEVLHYIEHGPKSWGRLLETGSHEEEIKNALAEHYEFLKKREQNNDLYFRRRTLLLLGVIAIGIWRGPVIKLVSYVGDEETQGGYNPYGYRPYNPNGR